MQVIAVAILALTVLVVVGTALVFVGFAVDKTSKMPAHIVIDAHEAIDFVADAIPVAASSVLSYDDVRRLIRLHTEWVQAYHWAPASQGETPIVFEEFDPLDYVMERADITGLEVEREHAAAVVEAHSSYLQFMGAIHIDDPVAVQADLAEMPLLDSAYEAPAIDAAGSTGDGPGNEQTGNSQDTA